MDMVKHDDYDTISNQVRRLCAQKLMELEARLSPFVSGDYGDINPGHATAYITLIKELGRLYEVQKRPRDREEHVPAAQVQAMLEAAQLRAEQMVADAVRETEIKIRAELESDTTKSIESAKTNVLDRLAQIGQPGG